jgi:hypothetical protein
MTDVLRPLEDPGGPARGGPIITDRVVPLFTRESYVVVHRTADKLVLHNDRGDTVTIEMTSRDDHTERHIWGVAPRIVRQGLNRISR